MLPRHLALLVATGILSFPRLDAANEPEAVSADVVIVGAGISGLAAALEAGRGGAQVIVLDMSSVFGGHAVMSEGAVSIVNSPVQQAAGLSDNPKQALADFKKWGGDINEDWARFYTENSRRQVFDWLTSLGVAFEGLRRPPGNSVARFHQTRGRGLGLVGPIYRECLTHSNIRFIWNTQATGLDTVRGRMTGVIGKNLRSAQAMRIVTPAVILATGGFQSNLQLLREYWPKAIAFPQRLLLGSGINSLGLGHELARTAGAELSHLEYQWMYPWGLPDPRDPRMERGLNAMNMLAIWVNADGHRFANELLSSKLLLPEVLRQPGGTYWAIFDEPAKKAFQIAGTDWIEFATIDRLIFGNEKIVQSGPTIAVLARTTGLPEKALIESVQRYNRLLDAGDDTDFSRFGPSAQRFAGLAITPLMPPSRIEQPPFYAVQFFPMSRKNNGGIKVDLSCRVLSPQGEPIPGLLAVGEVTGSGGMNGTAGLEGVWLGPGVLMGRVAGKTVLDELRNRTTPRPPTKHLPQSLRIVSETKSCTDCHKITELVAQSRPGYWHFEFVHRTVQQRNQNCLECHSDLLPNPAAPHRMNPLVQAAACVSCHGAK